MINNRENMSVSERLISSRQNRQLDEVRGRMIVTACALIMIAASVAITIFLGVKGPQSFLVNGVSPIEFLTSLNWNPTDSDPKYGGRHLFLAHLQ